jgi:hypothetical protein
MTASDPYPVHEWNLDSSWQDWPHGGLWNRPLDGQEPPPTVDPTAIQSGMTAPAPAPAPSPAFAPSMFDVGRSVSESE